MNMSGWEWAMPIVVAAAVFGAYALTMRLVRKRRQARMDRFYRGGKP